MKKFKRFVLVFCAALIGGAIALGVLWKQATSDKPIESLYKISLSQPTTENSGASLETRIFLPLSRSEAKDALQKSLVEGWTLDAAANGNYVFKQEGRIIVICLPSRTGPVPSGAKSVVKYARTNLPF